MFPFGTQKQTYQVFNTTLDRPLPFVYSGTATVGGIQTYEFVENVPATQFTTQAVPGSMLGVKTAVVRAPLFDQQHLINYVDPETGALLNVNEHQTVTLHNPATGAQALVLYDADLTVTPASLSQIVALDSSGRSEITLVETTLPLVFGIVGGVALLAGAFLGLRGASGAMTRPHSKAWPRPPTADRRSRTGAWRISAAAGGRRARGGWTRRPSSPAASPRRRGWTATRRRSRGRSRCRRRTARRRAWPW